MHSKLLVANWKSHKTISEATQWLEDFNSAVVTWPKEVVAVLCPPMPFLASLHHDLQQFPKLLDQLQLGVQDISPFPLGSYTGAVSAQQVLDFGAKYAVVGHSERRKYFRETNHDVALKVDQALEAGLTPIICLDEPYFLSQLTALNPDSLSKCVIAYEPLEAIGTGDSQPVNEVVSAVTQIRHHFGQAPVIYGGSVDLGNIQDYLEVTDGVLVGGASLEAGEFAQLITSVK